MEVFSPLRRGDGLPVRTEGQACDKNRCLGRQTPSAATGTAAGELQGDRLIKPKGGSHGEKHTFPPNFFAQ